ncbi:MAG: insulinase family protein [Flavobacteriia bacterium]|nr:insulinase family protein [Flavobacteriia bacterium]
MNTIKKYILSLGLIIPAILFGQVDRSIRPAAAKAPAINIKDSEVFTTSNGITVILSENHKLPKISFNMVMSATPMTEGSKAGLSSITGELILSGTTNRSKDQLDKEKDYIGADLSADKESLFLSCLTKHIDKGLDLMSDVLIRANFPQSEFDRIKNQTVSSLLSTKSSPESMANNAESKANFPKGHPYSEVMTEESLNNISLDDVKKYYKLIFTPTGSYLVIVGDITKAQATELVEKYFSKWSGDNIYNQEMTPSSKQSGNRVIFIKKPGAVQSVINVTFPLNVKPGDKDQLPLTVLNDIFGGGGFGTRLMQNLREDKAYTYGCYSGLNINAYGSSLSASGNFRNDVTDSAITQILFELDKITNGYVSDDELNLTKMVMAGNFARSLERPQTIARFALNIIKYKLPKDYYQTYLKRLESISKEDVLLMAQKYFTAKNCNIIVVGNEEVLSKLKQFDADGIVEVWDAFGEPIKETKKADITKEQLIEKYILATTQTTSIKNASKKIKKLKAFEEVAEVTIPQAPFPISSTRIWQTPNTEAAKIEAQGMVLQKSYFDGSFGATTSMQTGKKELTKEEIAAKGKSTGLLPELNYATSGMKYELIGIENLEGKEVYVLKLHDGNSESFDYFDTKTFMKVKSVKMEKTDDKMMEITSTYTEFKEVNGILFPFKMAIIQDEMSFNIKVISFTFKDKVDLKTFK